MLLTCVLAAALLAAPEPVRPAQSPFPLKVSANGRHLVDQAGQPFLIHADTPWFILQRLTREEATHYLDQRKALGFTAVMVMILAEPRDPTAVATGTPPLAEPGRLAGPNDAYFQHVDWFFNAAHERGMLVLVAPAWLSCCDGGWRHIMKAAGPEACRDYGAFLGRRYAKTTNIIWIQGGDRSPGEFRPEIKALVAGMLEQAPHHLMTYHGTSPTSAADSFPKAPWLTLNSTYTYSPDQTEVGQPQRHVYAAIRRDYERTPPRPTFLIESNYEGERKATPRIIRRQAYWAMCSGAAGHAFGNGHIYQFKPGWRDALTARGSQDMAHLAKLFRDLPWHELVPDEKQTFLTDGFGTFDPAANMEPGSTRGQDYATAAVTPGGTVAIIYIPTARASITVDIGQLKADATARWFDPTTGTFTPIGSVSKATGKHTIPVPPTNAAGDPDWVLVLTAN